MATPRGVPDPRPTPDNQAGQAGATTCLQALRRCPVHCTVALASATSSSSAGLQTLSTTTLVHPPHARSRRLRQAVEARRECLDELRLYPAQIIRQPPPHGAVALWSERRRICSALPTM